jgi:hypothetical protein
MRTKKYRLWAAALVVTVTGFTACLKSDDVTPPRPQANYIFLNASTYAPGIDVYQAGSKLYNTSFKLGQFADHYTYKGYQEFIFKKGGVDSTLGTITDVFDSLQIYTIVMYGETPQFRVVRNDFTNADNSKINFRFYQLSPNSGPVDLYLDGKKIDSARNYDGGSLRSGFTALNPAGIGTSRLTVKVAGKDSILAETTSPNWSMQTGTVHTIYYVGLRGATGDNAPKVNNVLSYF